MRSIVLLTIGLVIVGIVGSSFFLHSYTACGCGGCGGERPTFSFTFNPSLIIAANKAMSRSPDCALMGCSKCVRYFYFALGKYE